MESPFLSVGVIALIGASQSLLLCVVILAVATGNRLANRFLAAYVFVEASRLLYAFIFSQRFPPSPLFVTANVSLAAGPLLYLYVRALTTASPAMSLRMLVHFIPVLLGVLVSGLYFTDSYWTAFAIEAGDELRGVSRSPGVALQAIVGSLIRLIYSIASLRRLRAHEHNIRDQFSSLERIDLAWLRAVIVAGLVVSIVFIGYDVFRFNLGWDAEPKLWGSIVFTILIVYLISIGGLRQPLIFGPASLPTRAAHSPSVDTDRPQPDVAPKYGRSALDEQSAQALWGRLQRFMEDERPYLDSALNLRALAASLNSTPHDVSQAINTHAASFYEFVNRYRVEEAKRLLADPGNEDRSLLDVGLAAGFNSQATFYKHFKKSTGTTPRSFRASPEAVLAS